MEDLHRLWRSLSLTEEEETVVVEDEKSRTEEVPKHHYLLGQLLSIRPFNRQELINTMKGLWKPEKDLFVDALDVNCLSGDRETFPAVGSFPRNVPRCHKNGGLRRAGPPNSMICFFLNCCGLRAFSQQMKPQVIFLSETHLFVRDMERVKQQLPFQYIYVVPSRGDRKLGWTSNFVDG